MSDGTALPRIPGDVTDPPPKELPETLRDLERKRGTASTTLGVGARTYLRFMGVRVPLLVAGTTYYLFLAAFSLIAFAYGVAAIVGAERVADLLTEAVGEAFPGLIGPEGLDPERLRSVGQTTSIVGLLALLYAGGGGMVAASASLHQIYGMPRDPRPFLRARARLYGWLLLIGPLIVLSFVASTVLVSFAGPILEQLGLDSTLAKVALRSAGLLLTLFLDFAIVYLLLGVLGGIRPPRRARGIGAAVGAVAIQLLKSLMAVVIGFSASKPQYGALAVPIGMLLVLYLQTMALYGSAALTAGIAERDVPLEAIVTHPSGSTDGETT